MSKFCEMNGNINHIAEVSTSRVDGSPTGAKILTSTNINTGDVRDTLDGKLAKMDAQFNTQLGGQSEQFQDRFNTLAPIKWAAGLKVTNALQVYSHTDGQAVERSYLPDPKLVPFTTGATFADDMSAGRFEESSILTAKTPILSVGSTTARSLEDRLSYVVNVQDFGAVADGVTDNAQAFLRVREFVQNRGGDCKIVFPPSTKPYVYYQFKEPGQLCYYGVGTIFRFSNIKNLIIEGNNAEIKLGDGCHFGAFDPETGDPVPLDEQLPNLSYHNAGGSFLEFTLEGSSENVLIQNVNWNGNLDNHIIGGGIGDTGWQCVEYGLRYRGAARNVEIRNCKFHNSGLDGIYIGITNPDVHTDHNIALTNCDSQYNGRQGLSLCGGDNIVFTNCNFSNTGRGKIASAPKAGIDIEPELGVPVSGCKFFGCTVVNNAGAGLLTAVSSVLTYDNTFTNCKFVGTTAPPLYLTAATDLIPATFYACDIKGCVQVVGNSRFYRCNFSDSPTKEFPNVWSAAYYFANASIQSEQVDCNYDISQVRSGLFYYTPNVKGAKVTYHINSDDAPNDLTLLGVQSIGWGDIRIHDNMTGSAKIAVIQSYTDYSHGNITIAVDNGHIVSVPYTSYRDNAPKYYTAKTKQAVTGLLITADEAQYMGRGGGGIQITVSVNGPSGGNYLKGDIVYRNEFSAGGTMGWCCTTAGVAGSTAVFKTFGEIGA